MHRFFIISQTILFILILPFSTKSETKNAFNVSLNQQDSVAINFEKMVADESGDSLNRIDIHFKYGEYLVDQGNQDKSIAQLKIALRIAQNIKDDIQVATIANYLANVYASIGNFIASNKSYKIALESAEKTQNSGEIAKISMNLASNYNYTGEYEKAIKYGLYALKTKETTNNLTRICYHYIAMGNIFRENNNTVKWEEYVQKAYKMKDVEGCASFSDLSKIYNSLGGIAVQKGELDKGLLYYDTLLILSKEANYDMGICTALTNSAGIYKQLENYNKALELATEAENYFGENPYDILFSNNFKAGLYQIDGKFEEGLKLAKANIQFEEINNYSTEKLKTLQLLYELNFKLKNYNEAYFWNDSLRKVESQLRDEDIRQSLEELETRYETEKKEQQIDLLTTENKLKNQRINAGIIVVATLVLIILLIIYILSIRKKQALLKQNDLQQQVLRTQMNPHFIFNVLGSIQNYMLQNDTRKASNFLSQFASLTRATLNNSAAETISLTDEITMLKNYIELEKMRKTDTFNYEIIFDDDLETDFIQIPPMMIQPFIENAIKHGFKNIDYKGFLRLQISDKTDCIEFIIEDNGRGILKTEKAKDGHQSMAMNIFEKRRKLIQQRYKKKFKFQMQNLREISMEKTGIRITIDIPIIK